MPVFRYQAVDKRGRTLSGTMPANDEPNLEVKLKALGLWLTEAEIESAGLTAATTTAPSRFARFNALFQKNQRRELIDFCTLMTFQTRVGIPLVKALEVSAEDCNDARFKKVLQGVQAHIEAGLQFHEALRKYPGTFSPHFVSAVRAGELSSKLPETLGDLKDYLEWADKVISDVRQATMYPAIVLGVILVFMAFLFTFIIPKFAELLDKLHVPQPLLTRMVLTTSDLVRHTWWAWLPAMIFLFVGVPLARKISPKFALAVDRWKLRLPVFGELNLMLALSKFSHNLAILYRSGISIIEALKLCQQGLIGNLYVEQAVGEMSKDVQNGSTISEAMQRQPVFSAMLVRMVTMGENTGNLDKALENVSDYYNDTIPRRIKKLFTMMEPALMLFLIFTVGVIALAIYLPILSLMGHLR